MVRLLKCIIFMQEEYKALEQLVKKVKYLVTLLNVYALRDTRIYNEHIKNKNIYFFMHFLKSFLYMIRIFNYFSQVFYESL